MEFCSGGNRLYYETEGTGHPVVILHAMGTDHRSMKAWLEPVFKNKKGFGAIYVDLPWHGRSFCKNIDSTEGVRSLISAFLSDFLGEQPFSVMGHSYGGYIAQGLLDDKLLGLCLLAPSIHRREHPLPEKTVIYRDEEALKIVDSEICVAFDTLMADQSAENLQYFLDEVQPGRVLADRSFLASNWRESGYFFKDDPFVNPFTGPSLIIAGRLDSICGYKDYYVLTENMPNSSLVVLEAGHLMAIEKREIVQFHVGEWLGQLIQE